MQGYFINEFSVFLFVVGFLLSVCIINISHMEREREDRHGERQFGG